MRSGDELVSSGELRFRSREELEKDLSDAESPEMAFVAARGQDFVNKHPG